MPAVARNAAPMLSHGVYVKIGPSRRRAGFHPLGNLEIREEGLLAVHVGDGAAVMAPLRVPDPQPGSDQPVVAGPVPVRGMRPVRRDRAMDQTGIASPQLFAGQPEPRHRAGSKALQQHVGVVDQCQEARTFGVVAQVQHHAAAAAQPHVVAGGVSEGIAAGRLDLDDVGAVVGEQHAGDRPGDTPREVEDSDAVEDACHRVLLSWSSGWRRSGWPSRGRCEGRAPGWRRCPAAGGPPRARGSGRGCSPRR